MIDLPSSNELFFGSCHGSYHPRVNLKIDIFVSSIGMESDTSPTRP